MTLSNTVFASLIARDYLANGDGAITYDTDSGYEWLDLTYTRSMCLQDTLNNGCNNYHDYLASLDDGWLFANSQQVSNLLAKFAFASNQSAIYGDAKPGSGYYYYKNPNQTFISDVNALTLLGESMSAGSSLYGIKGFTRDNINGAHEQFMAYYNKNQSLGIVAFGDYHRVAQGKPIQAFYTYRVAKAESVFISSKPQITSTNVINNATALPEPASLTLFSLLLSALFMHGYYRRRKTECFQPI
ncbi:hypothetical protein [Colwellia chukchiensis]|nr:hypothetical protein [Colwellia chukchiensis]